MKPSTDRVVKKRTIETSSLLIDHTMHLVKITNKTFSLIYVGSLLVCMTELINFKLGLVFLGTKNRKQGHYVHVKVNSCRTYHQRNY